MYFLFIDKKNLSLIRKLVILIHQLVDKIKAIMNNSTIKQEEYHLMNHSKY